MRSRLNLISFMAAGVLCSGAASAHHSFASFDMTKQESISGTVRAFEWTNPHAWLWIDVSDGKGGVITYGFEGSAPGEMSRNGWSKRALNPGDKVTVQYRPLKNEQQHGGSFGRVTLADGRVLGGSGFGGAPGKGPGGPPGGGPPGGGPPGGGPPGGGPPPGGG